MTWHYTEWDSSEVNGSDLMCCAQMFQIKFCYEVGGMDVVPIAVLHSKTLPFDQVLQFPIDYFTVQNLFHYPLFFSVHLDIWGHQ